METPLLGNTLAEQSTANEGDGDRAIGQESQGQSTATLTGTVKTSAASAGYSTGDQSSAVANGEDQVAGQSALPPPNLCDEET